jgi:hypothetical protein
VTTVWEDTTSYLWPSPTLLIGVFVFFGLCLAWPAVGAARRGQWAWLVAIILLAPFAGFVWHFTGSRTRPAAGTTRS